MFGFADSAYKHFSIKNYKAKLFRSDIAKYPTIFTQFLQDIF